MTKKSLVTRGIFFLGIAAAVLFISLVLTKKIFVLVPDKNRYAVEGLDVSHYQGDIDWEEVDSKYRFVFVKATEGDTWVDKNFYVNAVGVEQSDRILGAYHFFHFDFNGYEQANNFIRTAGFFLELPPVVDVEFTGNPSKFEKSKIRTELKTCLDRMEEYYGSRPVIYTTRNAYRKIIRGNFDNPVWYRSLYREPGPTIKNLVFWQHHHRARIKGINGMVDLNVWKGSEESLRLFIMK